MNLYEVVINGTQQKIQASKPEVALNEAIRRAKLEPTGYFEGMKLASALKENHSIHLNINIKNLGKMVRIQKIDDRFTRQYVLKSQWEYLKGLPRAEHSTSCQCFSCEYEVCPDARTFRYMAGYTR